jgi:hypothetical protein
VAEQVFIATPIGIGKAQIIATPFQFEFTGEDRLKVVFVSSVDTSFSVALRIIRRDGSIDVASHGFAITGDRLVAVRDIAVGIGFVSNVVVRPVLSTIQTGQCYVTVFVARGGPTGAFVVIGQMLGGYTTLFSPLAWPGSPITPSIDGPGAAIILNTGNLAANVTPTYIVPVNTRWAVMTFNGALQDTSGAGQFVHAVVAPGGGGINMRVPTTNVHAAGTTVQYFFGRGVTYAAVVGGGTNWATAPLPVEVLLPSATQLNVIASNNGWVWFETALTISEWLTV